MIFSETLPKIVGSRLSLRWLTIRDVDALFGIFSNPEAMRYWSSPALLSVAEAEVLLKRIHESFLDKSLFQWGIALNSNDQVIGTCTLLNMDNENRRAEIGYALAYQQWGQGYMNEALSELIEFCFSQLNFHRLEADVDPRNLRSIRLLERLGFKQEGYLRERWYVAGEIQDALFWGLLCHEWQKKAC